MEREEGSQGVNSIDIVLKRVDLKAFSSRILRINPGGHTAFHSHAREHIAVVLTGRCKIETIDSVQELRDAMIVTIPSGEGHRFVNPGSVPLAILILNFFTEEEQKPVELLPAAKVEEESKPEGA
jgi:quercetin dioxygenase-like cupin family protein